MCAAGPFCASVLDPPSSVPYKALTPGRAHQDHADLRVRAGAAVSARERRSAYRRLVGRCRRERPFLRVRLELARSSGRAAGTTAGRPCARRAAKPPGREGSPSGALEGECARFLRSVLSARLFSLERAGGTSSVIVGNLLKRFAAMAAIPTRIARLSSMAPAPVGIHFIR